MRGPTATSGHRMSASVSWPTSDYASNDVITICISIAAILPSLLVLFLGIKMEARRARHTQSSQLPRTNVDVLDLVEDLFNHIFSSPTPRSETISILDLLFTEQLLLLQATFAAQHAVDLGHVTHTIYSMIGNFSLALALEMNGTMHDLDIHALTNMLHRSVREARNIQSGGRPDTDLEKLLRDFTPDFIDLLDGDRQPMERHFASGEPFAVCITGGELRDHNSKYQLCLREERTPEEADPGSYLYDLRPLVFSNAYRELKRDLLMLTHELYTERVFAAIGDEARWVTSTKLQPAALRQTAMEIAWTPPGVIKVSPESGFRSFTNQCKVYTEAHLGPSWDWWPLAPREYPFQHGYVRLAWSLPCGTVRHLDVQGIRLDTLLRTFRTAPDFMQSISMRPRGLTISRMLNTYCGLIARFVLSAIIYVATVLVEGSSTRHAVARTSRGPIRSFRGELLSETGDTLPSASTRHQSGALPQEEEAPAGSEDSPKDYQHNDGRLDSPEDSGHGDPPPNTNPNRAGFRFVYLCTKAGRSFRPSCLEGNGRQTDRNFFRDLKNQYKAARGSLRYHLSIWRFSHCEFYRIRKHGIDACEPSETGFPSNKHEDGHLYEFSPNPPDPGPPHGPISKTEFGDRFHLCEERYFSWQRAWQSVFDVEDDDQAYRALPKRVEPIKLDTARNEYVFGLYAREHRSFIGFCAWLCVSLLAPLIFFFLWLHVSDKPADLPAAAVPLATSISLVTILWAQLIHSREET